MNKAAVSKLVQKRYEYESKVLETENKIIGLLRPLFTFDIGITCFPEDGICIYCDDGTDRDEHHITIGQVFSIYKEHGIIDQEIFDQYAYF